MIRNFLFSRFNQFFRFTQEINFGHFEYNRATDLANAYDFNKKNEKAYKLYDFEVQQEVDSIKDPYEKQIRVIYNQFINKEIKLMRPRPQRLIKLEESGKVSNIRMIAEDANNYDPEIIEFEKLKMKVILEEKGAKEEYKQFLINRPYMKKFYEFEENRPMKHFIID